MEHAFSSDQPPDQTMIEYQPLLEPTYADKEVRLVAKPKSAEVHDGVFRAFIGIFTAIMGVFFLAFQKDIDSLFAIGVCVVYGAMYFGTPFVLRRVSGVRPHKHRWDVFLDAKMDTYTGWLTGREVLIQICTIPAALLLCVIGICVALSNAR